MTRLPPILVSCVGSGAYYVLGICCPMCGERPGLDAEGRIVDHDRNDILAMIDRGDFG